MGLIAFVDKHPIAIRSKCQGTVEASTYGSEFNSGWIAAEDSTGVWCVIRSLGVLTDKPTKSHDDNKAACNFVAACEGLNKNRRTFIALCKLREADAAGIIRPHHSFSIKNLSEFLTKALGREKHNNATKRLLMQSRYNMRSDRGSRERLHIAKTRNERMLVGSWVNSR